MKIQVPEKPKKSVKSRKRAVQPGGETGVELRETVKALQERAELLHLMMDALPVTISYVDADQRYRLNNRTYEEWFDCCLDDMTGRHLSEVLSEQHYAEILRHVEAALAGRMVSHERIVPFKDGTAHYITASYVPHFGAEGEVKGFFSLGVDITERRNAENRLAYKAYLLAAVNEAVIASDDRFVLTAWNQAAEKILGWKSSEVLGRPARDVMHAEFSGVDREEALQKLQDAGCLRTEMIFLRKDGSPVCVETTITALKDECGATTGYVSVHRDISERKRAQEELRTSHQQLFDIIEFLPDATFVIDRESRVIAWNRAIEEMTGVSKKEVLGMTGHAYAIPFYGDPRPILIDLVFDSGIDLSEYYDFIERKGNTVFGEVFAPNAYNGKGAYLWGTASPLFDARGNLIGAIQSIRDITDRKKARDAVVQSEKQLRYLSARLLKAQEEERKRIARELHDSTGQSLAALKFYVESALSSRHKGKTTEMYKSFERLIPMIQTAIEEARRIYMGLRPSMLDDLGITTTIKWYCREIQETCPGVRIEEQVDIAEEEIPDALKIVIFRIIQEAFNNIIKYSEAGYVQVSLVKNDSSIELTIADDGLGFDIESYLRRGHHERGLGLAGMKERMELTGGTFSIKSSRGHGTTVHGTWPLHANGSDSDAAFEMSGGVI